MTKFYYSHFSDEQKTAYKSISEGIAEYKPEIPVAYMNNDELATVFNAVLLDNPLIFHVDSYNFVSYSGGKKFSFRPVYKYSKTMYEKYLNDVSKFLSCFGFIQNRTGEEKEIYVHDFCLKNFTYDYFFSKFAYSVLGCVLKKSAVCEGIAKFVKLALDYLGVKCIVVIGDAINPISGKPEKHAWNIVKLGESSFHLDVTFDLCLSQTIKRYDYFNLSDKDIKRDHIIKGTVPACSSEGNDYYSKNKLVVSSTGEMKNFIKDNLIKGKNTLVFKIENTHDVENTPKRIIEIAAVEYQKAINKNTRINLNYNLSQLVFEIDFKL
jgi:hypothetical protein